VKSGEARIVEKIVGKRGRVVYDAGGAVLVEFNPGQTLSYFFIGKHYIGLTGEPVYITIAVREVKHSVGSATARFTVKRGLLGFRKKVLIEAADPLGEAIADAVKRSVLKSIAESPYEELVVKLVAESEDVGVLKVNRSIVVIGRSGLAYTLNAEKLLKRMLELNVEVVKAIADSLNL